MNYSDIKPCQCGEEDYLPTLSGQLNYYWEIYCPVCNHKVEATGEIDDVINKWNDANGGETNGA